MRLRGRTFTRPWHGAGASFFFPPCNLHAAWQGQFLPAYSRDERACEFGEGTHHGEHDDAHGGVHASEYLAFSTNTTRATLGQALDEHTEIVKVRGEPARAMHHQVAACRPYAAVRPVGALRSSPES
jgi:hypothetical protein